MILVLLAATVLAGAPDDALRGLRLPAVTQQLREVTTESDVQTILAATQAASLTAAQAHDVVWHATAAARAYQIRDLGMTVSRLVAGGSRGEELGEGLLAAHLDAEEPRRHVGRAP